MTIRHATPADQGAVLALFEELFDPPDAHRFYLASGMYQTSLNFGREID